MGREFEAAGGEIRYESEVLSIDERPDEVVLRTGNQEHHGRFLVTCSGLMADRVVRMLGIKPNFIICPFRGEYYLLPKQHNQIVNHLIYPIPDPAMPFLGVHLTRMIDGTVTVGPNAVLAMKREGYRKTDFSLSDMFETLTTPGILKVLKNNLRPGLIEMKNSLFKGGYLKQVQKYCPSIVKSDLTAYPAGVRAQAVSRDGKLIDDFLFVNTARSVSVCNAPSPAATSAIPIGAYIVDKVREQLASTGASFVKPVNSVRLACVAASATTR
ncbi:L-2-hydroxyglutarate oxidase LhgO [compost metagenome]